LSLHIFQGTEVTQPVDPTNNYWHQRFILLQQEHALVLNQLSVALQSIAKQGEEIQTLRDEIARLNGSSPRPKLPPGKLEGSGGGSGGTGGKSGVGRGKHPRQNKKGLNFHSETRLKPENIPDGAIFKGTRKYDVQNIVCQAYNTRYIIERWQLPDGTYIEGQLPIHIQGHYGAELRSHVLMLAYSCRVSEEEPILLISSFVRARQYLLILQKVPVNTQPVRKSGFIEWQGGLQQSVQVFLMYVAILNSLMKFDT
jgi:hypothetical protein